jgi:hypothetical protein
MNSLSVKTNLIIYTALVMLFMGCSHFMDFGKPSADPIGPPDADDKYTREIVELKQVVRQESRTSKAKTAHLKLARLYSDHHNLRRNYRKALEHLEAYISLEDSAADDEMMNWMASLREIDRLSKEIAAQNKQINEMQGQLKQSKKAELALSRTNRKLTREEINLREQNRNLEKSNQKLQQTIEMLTDLDQRLEEKRRNFNN